jgi:hypothetical protein
VKIETAEQFRTDFLLLKLLLFPLRSLTARAVRAEEVAKEANAVEVPQMPTLTEVAARIAPYLEKAKARGDDHNPVPDPRKGKERERLEAPRLVKARERAAKVSVALMLEALATWVKTAGIDMKDRRSRHLLNLRSPQHLKQRPKQKLNRDQAHLPFCFLLWQLVCLHLPLPASCRKWQRLFVLLSTRFACQMCLRITKSFLLKMRLLKRGVT